MRGELERMREHATMDCSKYYLDTRQEEMRKTTITTVISVDATLDTVTGFYHENK
jgi:hypothetical protein